MPLRLAHCQFYGQVIRARLVGGLYLSECRYAPRTRLPSHSHEHGYFCLVRRGHYREFYDSRERSCGPLTVAFHPPGEIHAEQFADETCSFNVEVTNAWLERWRLLPVQFDWSAAFEGGALAGLALRLYSEFIRSDDAALLAIEGLTLEILAAGWRGAQPVIERSPPRWLKRVHERIHEGFALPLSLTDLAEQAGVHPVHVAAAFRRYYGCTVGQYVRRRRIEFACQELTASSASLSKIALAAGFADQSHFSRVFKRLTGVTPLLYRQTANRS